MKFPLHSLPVVPNRAWGFYIKIQGVDLGVRPFLVKILNPVPVRGMTLILR